MYVACLRPELILFSSLRLLSIVGCSWVPDADCNYFIIKKRRGKVDTEFLHVSWDNLWLSVEPLYIPTFKSSSRNAAAFRFFTLIYIFSLPTKNQFSLCFSAQHLLYSGCLQLLSRAQWRRWLKCLDLKCSDTDCTSLSLINLFLLFWILYWFFWYKLLFK